MSADSLTPCACRATGARDCYSARYPRPPSYICDDADDELEREACECSCHDPDEDEYDAYANALWCNL